MPQHVGEYSASPVIGHLHRCIDAQHKLELSALAARGVDHQRGLALWFEIGVRDHVDRLNALQPQAFPRITRLKLQRQHAHAHQVAAVDALKAPGHHDVMMRGTFANVRIKNLMIAPDATGSREEGGVTIYQHDGPDYGNKMAIFDAAMQYIADGVPTVIFAGEEYGTGSSRDWAAKGTQLLGIKAVVARSFERIHRSNLVGMGVLPLQFKGTDSWQSLGLKGDECIDVIPSADLTPQSDAILRITRADGSTQEVTLTLRVDTPIEVDYYRAGGILPFVLRQLLA